MRREKVNVFVQFHDPYQRVCLIFIHPCDCEEAQLLKFCELENVQLRLNQFPGPVKCDLMRDT